MPVSCCATFFCARIWLSCVAHIAQPPAPCPNPAPPSSPPPPKLPLAAGDVIIMGSDGLFDNVWDEQLLALVASSGAAGGGGAGGPQVLAAALANTAYRNAQDPAIRSPWAVELANQPQVGRGVRGGGGQGERGAAWPARSCVRLRVG